MRREKIQSATSMWRRRELIFICRAAVVAALGLLGSCSQSAGHQGRWQCGGAFISIHDDGVGSFSGERATWTSIGGDTIRLEFQEDGAPKVAELTVLGKRKSEARTATLNLGGLEVGCVELPIKAESERG
jgi:hypothetical protein